MPSVNALYKDYKGRGLEVRLIDFRESPDVVRKTVAERGYTAPVLLAIVRVGSSAARPGRARGNRLPRAR